MRRGYYLEDAGDMLTFPVAERPGSLSNGREEIDIQMEAESGKRFVEKQGKRRIWKLKFRLLNPTTYAFFETLHETVDGQATPFYFVVDASASPRDVFLVRKEKDFLPVPLDQFVRRNGQPYQIHDYTLELTEEIDAELSIEA